MTTTIEPTQEQRDVALAFMHKVKFMPHVNDVRHLLAEHEAKLRAEVDAAAVAACNAGADYAGAAAALDALTKRNATLLADKSDLSRQLRRVEEDRDNLAGFRDAVCATARSVAPDVDGGPVAVLHKLRDTSSMLEAHARDSQAEVVALKAKLAKAEASLREVLNLAHGADDGLTLADCIPTEVAARAESALSPAGAGTEWAAPIAAADAEKRGTP
jgi:hypothetical protein